MSYKILMILIMTFVLIAVIMIICIFAANTRQRPSVTAPLAAGKLVSVEVLVSRPHVVYVVRLNNGFVGDVLDTAQRKYPLIVGNTYRVDYHSYLDSYYLTPYQPERSQ